jgi:hypothetical protein
LSNATELDGSMNSNVIEPVLPPVPDLAGLQPLESIRSRWPIVIGGVLTAAMVIGLAYQLFSHGLHGLSRAVPESPWFYVFFTLLYLSPPTGDYVIFRRLWRIPIDGWYALIKKRIANEVLVGYSGDAYFYTWARARAKMIAAPFGAVKDVTILSAIAGNAMTLAMTAMALPLATHLLTKSQFHTVLGSAAITFAISLPFLIFSKRVFSLPRPTLWWIFTIHCLRLIAGSILIALCWHFGLPTVSVGMWLFLAAARLLVSRLPLVPNKDLLFANFAIILIGQGSQLSDLVAFTAALTLVYHVVLIVAFGLLAVAEKKKAV